MKHMDRSAEVIRYIASFWAEKGYAPSFREIAVATGLKDTSTVAYHLHRLREEKRVTFVDGLARTVRVL